jgi:hypothetical protein
MSPSERDQSAHRDSPADNRPNPSEHMGSSADSEDSAAHIAELVRRAAQRIAAPGPSSVVKPDVVQPDVTVRQPAPMPTAAVGQPQPKPIDPLLPPPPRPSRSRPSRRALSVGGAALALLLLGGVALSHSFGSEVRKRPVPAVQSTAPSGYTVKLSDVVIDCAAHARGRVKISFGSLPCVKATRSLATGQISGRPALFVVSRIQMASAEAAASIKQVLDGSGTGNLNDLLREGKTFPGAPKTMPVSGYTSVQTGTVVTVVEAGFMDGGPSSSTDAALRASAAQVAATLSAQK